MQLYQETTMNLTTYKKAALSTAYYPGFGENILYPIIAVFEECGELVEKLEERAPHAEVAKECGDILWYCAMVFHELQEDFVFKVEKTYMTPLMLMTKLSRAAGIIKKSQRDNDGVLTEQKKEELLSYMDFVLSFVHNVGSQIDYTIEEICDMNIKKIESRKSRGQLSGEGDNR